MFLPYSYHFGSSDRLADAYSIRVLQKRETNRILPISEFRGFNVVVCQDCCATSGLIQCPAPPPPARAAIGAGRVVRPAPASSAEDPPTPAAPSASRSTTAQENTTISTIKGRETKRSTSMRFFYKSFQFRHLADFFVIQ